MLFRSASMFLEQGVRIIPFVSLWLIMTIQESWPEDRGRSVMRSMESCLNGRSVEEGMGDSGGHVGWWFTLFCWQVVQPEMKVVTNEDRPGHQKSRLIMALV